MFQIRRIVVGVEMPAERPWKAANLGLPSRLSVQNAFQTAESARIPVTLVSVLPKPKAGWFGSQEESERQAIADRSAAQGVLEELKNEMSPSGNCSVDLQIRLGDAWEELIRAAGNRPDCLLIVGTRDLGSIRRVLFGSTGLKLLRLSPTAVWILKPRIDDNDSTDIVAATDLGPVGADVIQTSVRLARLLNARLHIVHAADGSEPPADVESKIQAQLAETDFRTLPFGIRTHIQTGSPDSVLLAAVAESKADLLILGTSSKTGVSGLLPGSTVERLLPELTCSVLALKPEGFRSMLPSDFWSVQRSAEV